MFKNKFIRAGLIGLLLIAVGLVYGGIFGTARVYNYQANDLVDIGKSDKELF